MGTNLRPPGSEWMTANPDTTDVLRHFARDYGSSPHRPVFSFGERPDLWLRGKTPSDGDPRDGTNDKIGCPTGTHSAAAGADDACTFGSTPICQGGTEDGNWCRDGTDADCGGGTCVDVPFDPLWALTIPTAEHAAAMATIDHVLADHNINFDNDWICDGTVVEGTGQAGCGTGYPNWATYAEAAANLPPDSYGKAAADACQCWPLPQRPIYYISGDLLKDTPAPGEWTADAISTIAMDLRIEAWREWYVSSLLDQIWHTMLSAGFTEAQIQTWPLAANGWHSKPGWWSFYTRHSAVPVCDAADCSTNTTRDDFDRYVTGPCRGADLADTHMWKGPSYVIPGLTDAEVESCAEGAGPIHSTPYGPGEFQAASAALGLLIKAQTGPGHYFQYEMKLDSDDTPALLDIGNQAVPVSLQKDSRWAGARLQILGTVDAPWSTGEDLCRQTPIVDAGGPYVVDSGELVRLSGMCVVASPTEAVWSGGGVGCAFTNPYDGSASINDPMPNLSGCTESGTITLTCGTSTDTAIVIVLP
jgi:hypothetical protein